MHGLWKNDIGLNEHYYLMKCFHEINTGLNKVSYSNMIAIPDIH